jgi:undecaprenyl-diphosphatase
MPPWLEVGRARGVDWDWRCARALHRGAARPRWQRTMALCSRLGDAPLWVAATLLLLLAGGFIGWRLGLLALLLGTLNLSIYWGLKHWTRRERPFRQCDDIRECVRAADPFSFPSGHAMHATAYAVLFSIRFPSLTLPLAGFAALVALSRVVLGVHFPSDVLAGAAIGAATAGLVAFLL